MTYPGINMHGPDFSLCESNIRIRSRPHSSKFGKKAKENYIIHLKNSFVKLTNVLPHDNEVSNHRFD